ncbi:TPA: hypothetical protein ACJ5DT_000054 [Legionella pneumophila]|uniref:hypothetical protein n=1 Tax=Legionella pneumophila TaxID=446 RepID=UPI000770A683|nr:hypothetical protein [Legionella pneumophila]APF02929.1 hypothetical protein BIZ52_05980 [Legionella pneumophila subsp. fraseri]APF05959.1 hypothetical protein BIZ51_06095 [Legionella pneumophila subsp. fraseri]MBG1728550.1 hypothetical protein [Legionella pneumophila]MCW8428129.1 hypothetical protein [Legionella pneumophila]CZF99184.1 Uncharacterised protein [Legionella pneumophila]
MITKNRILLSILLLAGSLDAIADSSLVFSNNLNGSVYSTKLCVKGERKELCMKFCNDQGYSYGSCVHHAGQQKRLGYCVCK